MADIVHEGALEHYRAEGKRLMAELAKVNTKGGRNAYARRVALIEIDRVLDQVCPPSSEKRKMT